MFKHSSQFDFICNIHCALNYNFSIRNFDKESSKIIIYISQLQSFKFPLNCILYHVVKIFKLSGSY